jgi:phospholipid/cholesterol/gamma-HCH transport system permease protein
MGLAAVSSTLTMSSSKPAVPYPSSPPLSPRLARGQTWLQGMQAMARASIRLWVLAAQLIVLMLTPASYGGTRAQSAMQQLVQASLPLLPGFLVLSALISVVLVRIVLAAASELGVSQFALNLLIRTLVLELLPLIAASFVALRYSLVAANALGHERSYTPLDVVPFCSACVFAVLLLAVSGALLASVIAYVSVYGLSVWGLASFNTLMAQIFTPTVMVVLGCKTLLSALAVAVVPFSAVADGLVPRSDLVVFARLMAILLLIELLSLVSNYY